MAPRPDIAIDLGSSHTRLGTPTDGVLISLPTVIAMRGSEITAVGDEAYAMLEGGTHPGQQIVQPVRTGSVVEFAAAERLLATLLQRFGRSLRGPRVALTLGSTQTEVEQRAVVSCLRGAGARDVSWIDPLVAAASGAALPIQEPRGQLVIDLGAGGTRVGILCLGQVVLRSTAPTGGDAVTEHLRTWLKHQHNVALSSHATVVLKHRLVTLPHHHELVIRGTATRTPATAEVALTARELLVQTTAATQPIFDTVLGLLREASPELAADILDQGGVTCGGGALLGGFGAYLRDATRLSIVATDQPSLAAIRGALALAAKE